MKGDRNMSEQEEFCGCKLKVLERLGYAIVYCPMHKAAPALLEALDELLKVKPRPVQLPCPDDPTTVELTVSYTGSDLVRLKTATAAIAAAKKKGGEA